MDGASQRAHTTRMDQVESAVASFGEAAIGRIGELEAAIVSARREIANLRGALSTEHTHRMEQAHEQRTYVDAEDQRVRLRMHAFIEMDWRERWAWLLGWR